MTLKVTKEFMFEACHNLPGYDGDCANMHGHSYKLQVSVQCVSKDIAVIQDLLDSNNGMLMDFKALKRMVDNGIIAFFDHAHINKVVKYQPTAENMVIDFYNRLEFCVRAYDGRLRVCEIKLWETATSFASYKPEVE